MFHFISRYCSYWFCAFARCLLEVDNLEAYHSCSWNAQCAHGWVYWLISRVEVTFNNSFELLFKFLVYRNSDKTSALMNLPNIVWFYLDMRLEHYWKRESPQRLIKTLFVQYILSAVLIDKVECNESVNTRFAFHESQKKEDVFFK